MLTEARRGHQILWAWNYSSCKPPDLDAGNQMRVSYKSNSALCPWSFPGDPTWRSLLPKYLHQPRCFVTDVCLSGPILWGLRLIASVLKPSILTQNKEEREMVEGPKIWLTSFGPFFSFRHRLMVVKKKMTLLTFLPSSNYSKANNK